MHYPEYRAHRGRRRQAIRRLLAETELSPRHLICPILVGPGKGVKEGVAALPGIHRYSVDRLKEPLADLARAGIGAVYLQPVAISRDDLAREAARPDGVMARAVEQVRGAPGEVAVFADLDIGPYTSHGLGGVIQEGELDEGATLELLGEMALVMAGAGADFLVQSLLIDGHVGFLRETLDEGEFEDVGIVACSARYRSLFDAPLEAPKRPAEADLGARLLDPANARAALREVALHVDEGADMIMVRPAMPCLDILARLADEIEHPLIACCGVGECQALVAAAEKGWLDRDAAHLEQLLALRRGGADAVVSFYALEAARTLSA